MSSFQSSNICKPILQDVGEWGNKQYTSSMQCDRDFKCASGVMTWNEWSVIYCDVIIRSVAAHQSRDGWLHLRDLATGWHCPSLVTGWGWALCTVSPWKGLFRHFHCVLIHGTIWSNGIWGPLTVYKDPMYILWTVLLYQYYTMGGSRGSPFWGPLLSLGKDDVSVQYIKLDTCHIGEVNHKFLDKYSRFRHIIRPKHKEDWVIWTSFYFWGSARTSGDNPGEKMRIILAKKMRLQIVYRWASCCWEWTGP